MPTNPPDLPATSLKLSICAQADATVVECSGPLSTATVAGFKKEVKGLMPGTKRIVLDLNHADYMDSSGLGALLGLYLAAKDAGCHLRLINLNEQIRELLHVTNVLSLFEPSGGHDIQKP
jgi:anti-anti-sigma factor